MKRIILVFFCFLLGFSSAVAEKMKRVPIESGINPPAKISPFCFWRMEYSGGKEGKYKPFLMNDKNGKFKKLSGFKGKPRVDLKSGIYCSYGSPGDLRGNDLNKSKEVVSPDGDQSIRFYWNMTFADDENNVWLILKNTKTKREEKVFYPGSCMGLVSPLFWNGPKNLFYFMVGGGVTTDSSSGLFQFDVSDKSFLYVGTTNGRAFLSPDNKWVVWETGRMMSECGVGYKMYCTHLVLYDVDKGKNYQLTDGKSVNLFDHWKE